MSQYAALMIMEREYGPEQMRRFLKYELDSYLRARSGELIEELPLLVVENQVSRPSLRIRRGSAPLGRSGPAGFLRSIPPVQTGVVRFPTTSWSGRPSSQASSRRSAPA